ncbi:MAG: class I SAM-dependent methyltransferase [bacterium]|nr:class I SAM-dependent methyltransferase [bacterium]
MKNIFCCPDCRKDLSIEGNLATCNKCRRRFYFSNNVWNLLPKILEKNKINEDKLHFNPSCDVYKYNKQVWRCLIDLAPHLRRFEKEILPKIDGKKRILELACGTGWASALVKNAYPRAEVYASDVSPNVLRLKTTKLCEIMDSGVDYFVAADAERLPFATGSFDFIFAIASLHHFPDIAKVLNETKRVLSPWGVFLGIDGAMPRWCQRLIFGREKKMERAKDYGILEQLLTYRQWKEIIKNVNLSPKSVSPYTDPNFAQSANNRDEAKILRFSAAKKLFFNIIKHLPRPLVEFFCLMDFFPTGIVIEFTKGKED